MRFLIFTFLLLSSFSVLADTVKPIEVTDQKVKIKGGDSLSLYFGFAKGDVIVFSLEMKKGKSIEEVEIAAWPHSVKYTDYKSEGVTEKRIKVNKEGVYSFTFHNKSLLRRVCHIKIKRIPATEKTTNFNTAIKWVTVNDTTFYTEEIKYEAADTNFVNVVDRVQKVPPKAKLKSNENTFNFRLPQNTIAWSYYLGVNQEGQEAYQEATEKLALYATPILSKIPTYGPLVALALHGVSYFTKLQKGEDIEYYIVPDGQEQLFLQDSSVNYIKKGKVINDFAQISRHNTGTYHFCLRNDNLIIGVQVTIKVVAVTVQKYWAIKKVKRFEVQEKTVPVIVK